MASASSPRAACCTSAVCHFTDALRPCPAPALRRKLLRAGGLPGRWGRGTGALTLPRCPAVGGQWLQPVRCTPGPHEKWRGPAGSSGLGVGVSWNLLSPFLGLQRSLCCLELPQPSSRSPRARTSVCPDGHLCLTASERARAWPACASVRSLGGPQLKVSALVGGGLGVY